jgi:hypothetical protein
MQTEQLDLKARLSRLEARLKESTSVAIPRAKTTTTKVTKVTIAPKPTTPKPRTPSTKRR